MMTVLIFTLSCFAPLRSGNPISAQTCVEGRMFCTRRTDTASRPLAAQASAPWAADFRSQWRMRTVLRTALRRRWGRTAFTYHLISIEYEQVQNDLPGLYHGHYRLKHVWISIQAACMDRRQVLKTGILSQPWANPSLCIYDSLPLSKGDYCASTLWM